MAPRIFAVITLITLFGCGGGDSASTSTTISNPANFTMPAGGVSAVPPNTN